MLASIVEIAQVTNLLLLRAHFKLSGNAPEVARVPRPGALAEPEPPMATIHDIRAALLGTG